MTRKRYYAIINGYYHRYHDGPKDLDTLIAIEKEYREAVCPALCKYNFHLTRSQALFLCDTLGQGNWKKMWLTEEEKSENAESISTALIGDIFYCSDRMSWDRLVRINWQYQRLLKRIIAMHPAYEEKVISSRA